MGEMTRILSGQKLGKIEMDRGIRIFLEGAEFREKGKKRKVNKSEGEKSGY